MSEEFTRTCLASELETFRRWNDGRDALVIRAYQAGICKNRIYILSGLSRTTIDRIVGAIPRACPCCGKPKSEHQKESS